MRLADGRRGLRTPRLRDAIIECIRAGKERFGCRLLHYSIQDTHLHLVCEADDRESLSLGIQGLKIRIAKRLNKEWSRKGPVWSDRYHLTVAKTLKQVSKLLRYVLENFRKHNNQRLENELDAIDWDNPSKPDPCASAQYLPRTVPILGLALPGRPNDFALWPVARSKTSLIGTAPYHFPVTLGRYETLRVLHQRGLAPICA